MDSCVLVLGGCHDETQEPVPGGLRNLTVLEFADDTGSQVRVTIVCLFLIIIQC